MEAATDTIRRIRATLDWLYAMPDAIGDRNADGMTETICGTIDEMVEWSENPDLQTAVGLVEARYDNVQRDENGKWPETYTSLDHEYWDAVEAELGLAPTPPKASPVKAAVKAALTEWRNGQLESQSVVPLLDMAQQLVDEACEEWLDDNGIVPEE